MSTLMLDAATAPQAIEDRSFAIIDAEIPEPRPFQGPLWEVARRLIHTTGDVDILPRLRLDAQGLHAGVAALRAGCIVYTDTEMARLGMPLRRLSPLGVRVQSLMGLPVAETAKAQGITRSRAGILQIRHALSGSIVAIGNAPTALLALLEVLEQGAEPPALIIGMPVGFVNAAQSKELLHRSRWPHFTLLGRKGGSPLAAAAVNALAVIAARG